VSLPRHTSSKQSHVFAAARINARQATSTRVAFSDDEDADNVQRNSETMMMKKEKN
jgi:hypothetical protein